MKGQGKNAGVSGGGVVHAASRYDALFHQRKILAHSLHKVVPLAYVPFVAVVARIGRKRERPGGGCREGRRGAAGEGARRSIGGGVS